MKWISHLGTCRVCKGLVANTLPVGNRLGWRGWLVAGLLYPRFRVRPRPKSMDFPNAENRQWPCRMIIRQMKDP
ncbi:hypothetical protein TNCV_225071 [Trichonephila clavipes]|nr:hypothetical protein TNCV_225071 [Trichonephila clavipes]